MRIFLLSLLLAFSFYLLPAQLSAEQPKTKLYQGKSLRHWLWTHVKLCEEGIEDPNEILKTLCASPATALSQLAAALADPDERVRVAAVELMGQCGSFSFFALPQLLEAAREDRSSSVRAWTIDLLGALRSGRDFTLPPMIQWWLNRSLTPTFIQALQDRNASVRLSGASVLRDIRPGSKQAISALLKAIDDPDLETRVQIILAIAETAEPKTAMPALLAAFKRNDEDRLLPFRPFVSGIGGEGSVHGIIAVAAGEVGRAAVPYLVNGLGDTDRLVRAGSALALGYLRQNNESVTREVKAAIPTIAALLRKDKESFVRCNAARGLGLLGAEAGPVAKEIGKALEDPAKEVRAAAAAALTRLGVDGGSAVPALVRALKTDRDNASALLQALKAIGPASAPAISTLIELLKHPEQHIQLQAADALGAIGPAAKAAVPALTEMSKKGGDAGRYARDAIQAITRPQSKEIG